MGLDSTLGPITIEGKAEVLDKPGVLKLDEYPRLVFAPGQHGPGIRTEDKGISVHQIAAAYEANPNAQAIADSIGSTIEHVLDALRYALASGFAVKKS